MYIKKIFRKSFESFLSFLIYKHYNVDIKGRNVKMNQDNILVVEDEIEIAKAIEIYLKSQNYNVYIANNGLEGLKIIEQHPIHLAIVDIMMPVMDGIEMTMKIREQYDFPIIFLSAKSEDIDKITGLSSTTSKIFA